MIIRPADPEDAERIAEIYNHYIKTSHATFEVDEITAEAMLARIEDAWSGGYPFLVTALDDRIAGYAYGHRFREREAYGRTVEVSVYIRPDLEQRGIATQLYEQLFSRLRDAGFHALIAGIALPNNASIRLHERFGMKKVAHFLQVGRKFGRWIDVAYWQLILEPSPDQSSD